MLIRDLERNTGLDRANHPLLRKGGHDLPGAERKRLLAIFPGGSGYPFEDQAAAAAGNEPGNHPTIAVCEEMRIAKVSYETLDAGFYLEQLTRLSDCKPYQERIPREYHPWRRFFARMLDYWIPGVLLQFLLVVVLRIRPFEDVYSNLITYGTPFLMVPVNAMLLSRFGTTLGKWLLDLRVESENGGNLTYEDAVNREWAVLKRGLGFGIPGWELWRTYQCKKAYETQDMEWDGICEYRYGNWNKRRKQLLAVVVAAYIVLIAINAADLTKPRYRGDLTVAEFADNYNFYYGIIDGNVTRSERLQSDGSWYPESDESVTIYQDGQPLIPEQTFLYQTENGTLASIRYENSWVDIFALDLPPRQCMNAVITILMSQKGSSVLDLFAFADVTHSADFTEDGQLTYKNLVLQWNVDAQNCIAADHQTFVPLNESENTLVNLAFEIRWNNNG